MNETEGTENNGTLSDSGSRDWIAQVMGVGEERKASIYKELSISASLLDLNYWLQIFFSAGIATLGLALNSPAVIIGAMLISPLMGPILSAGLSLAAGDVILGIRSLVKLALSCILAIMFAVSLVSVLPFEITAEIAARTQPNTLDLMVALFSGAVGSLAICKETKGVVTSIPGVAIAVALIPPLCVVGFGFALALTLNPSDGIRTARGGGLLFLTNLVAITFTAMIVFLSIHIDTERVRNQIRKWMLQDSETLLVRNLLKKFRVSENVRKLGSLPGRLLMIVLPILLLTIPLSQSMMQLRNEITTQRNENRIRRTVTSLWEENFGTFGTGLSRSFIDQVAVTENGNALSLFMRAFTSQPVNQDERRRFIDLVASKLNKPPQAVELQLIEIPTTSARIESRTADEKIEEIPPTVAQLQTQFLQGLDRSLQGLRFPAPATLLTYQARARQSLPLELSFIYLSQRDIDSDGQTLIAQDVRSRTNLSDLSVGFQRVESYFGPLKFARNQSNITPQQLLILDAVGETLQQWPSLKCVLMVYENGSVQPDDDRSHEQAIIAHLLSKWNIDPGRITFSRSGQRRDEIVIQLQP